MVPHILRFGFSLLSRGPGKQRGGTGEAKRRIRGPKEENPGRNRANPGRQRGENAITVSFVPEYVLFVPGFGEGHPNLPGVLEKKMLFVPGFVEARPRFPTRPSHF